MRTKTIKITMCICISILVVQFLAAGIGKLLGAWTLKFTGWGYPIIFMYSIGFFEIIGVVGLFFFKVRRWSAILFMLIMAGAAYTHISNAEYSRVVHNGIVAMFSLLVIQLDRKLE